MKCFSKYIVVNFVIFCFCFANPLQAQIIPPDIECVSNDTVYWSIPINTCGPFVSYDLYFATNENGPYSLLNSITNNALYFYFHENPTNTTYYYYMVSNFSCPTETAVPSDTINNLPLSSFPIERVTVVGNDAIIEWNPPQVAYAYIIYKDTDIGTVPIDTVFGVTSYTDLNAMVNSQSETYYVVALNECGGTSIFNDPHSSIRIDTSMNACTQTISLEWNLYQNWPGGIDSHEILMSANGDPYTVINVVDGNTNTFDFTDTDDGDTYCFVIKAISSNPSIVSESNEVCLQADIIQPNRELILKNVSVNGANQVEITWSSQSNAEFVLTNVERRIGNELWSIVSSEPAIPPVLGEESFVNDTDLANFNQLFYQVVTTDICGTSTPSNYGSTILVTGNALGNNTNQVNWTDFDIEGATLTNYELYRLVDGDSEGVLLNDDQTTGHTDIVDPSNSSETLVCYYVIAKAMVTLPDGSLLPISSRSNTFCIQQSSKMFVPNAFAPDGVNKEFKPVVVFGQNAIYEMNIFDRWGRVMFTTNEVEVGWLGKDGDRLAAQGTYMYQIRLVQEDGNKIERNGVVVLLR